MKDVAVIFLFSHQAELAVILEASSYRFIVTFVAMVSNLIAMSSTDLVASSYI